MSKFKVGDVVRNVSDNNVDVTIGKVYHLTGAWSGGVEFRDDDGDTRTRPDEHYVLANTSAPPAPKLPRLELQAAPQGGFLVVAPSASMGSMSETLSAHSEIGDALEFMRRAMA